MRYKIVLLLCCYFPISWAADIDLSVETNLTAPVLVTANGVVGEFSITITNHGPSTAGISNPYPSSHPIEIIADSIFLDIYDDPNDNGYPVLFARNAAIQQDCNFSYLQPSPVPGDPPQISFAFGVPPLSAGESVTCYGLYSAYFNDLTRIMDIGWVPHSTNDIDLDPSNDRVVMSFQGFVHPVPSLSFWGLLLMGLIVVWVGIKPLRCSLNCQ